MFRTVQCVLFLILVVKLLNSLVEVYFILWLVILGDPYLIWDFIGMTGSIGMKE